MLEVHVDTLLVSVASLLSNQRMQSDAQKICCLHTLSSLVHHLGTLSEVPQESTLPAWLNK